MSSDEKIGTLVEKVSLGDPYKKFQAMDIPEVFTIQELSEQVWKDLKRPDPLSDRNTVEDVRLMSQIFAQDEPMAFIRYAASNTEKFWYQDSKGRGGNAARLAMVLPLEAAQSFFDAAKQNPELVHTLVDVAANKAMDQHLAPAADWPDMKPPIEDWRQANGQIPMAFQDSLLQDPAQAAVVNY